ncbi:MAG: hypothetical protein HY841_04795 [Bacteroidetes bacterium]|nr:hypothetical protein [Bacteroidota bacterium]
MEATFDRNNRLIAMGITTLFAILLFLIFLFIKFITPIPPFDLSPMGGLEVNYGLDESGMGDNNSMQPVSQDQKKDNASQTENNSSSEMLSSDEASNVVAPVVKNKKLDVKETPPQPDQNLLNALNKVHSNTGSNTGDGNTNTPGNQGDPNGSLNSNVYSEFKGPGAGGKLKGFGRKMIGDVAIYDDSQETGIVAVEILVDKYGKIIKAESVLIGSTTTSSLLWKKAKDGLLNKVLFNQSPTGEEARGTIYINFTVR